MENQFNINEDLKKLGIEKVNEGVCTGTIWKETSGKVVESFSPSDGEKIAEVRHAGLEDYHEVIETAKEAFKTWRTWPAPRRGEIVRKSVECGSTRTLGKLVSYEMGKFTRKAWAKCRK
jgi:aldehyde dehydrogenase (NAD+)